MGPYLMHFSIRDLEQFSGVKAHTIRMWEKRYGLLAPQRTDTNIRTYGIDELKAILTVAYLNRHGHKISRIAGLKPIERDQLAREVARSAGDRDDVLDSLKVAMLSFDEQLFEKVTSRYRADHTFSQLVEQVFVPLLEQIGMLWVTNAICPAHEHFISNLLRQKLLAATDGITVTPRPAGPVHVLYLPENEIHELGLLYVNYVLRLHGHRTIYLGQSVPRQDLLQVEGLFQDELVLVTLLMANPPPDELQGYLDSLRTLLPQERVRFWIAGAQVGRVADLRAPAGMSLFTGINDLLKAIG